MHDKHCVCNAKVNIVFSAHDAFLVQFWNEQET